MPRPSSSACSTIATSAWSARASGWRSATTASTSFATHTGSRSSSCCRRRPSPSAGRWCSIPSRPSPRTARSPTAVRHVARSGGRAPAPRRMREQCGTSHSRRTTTGPGSRRMRGRRHGRRAGTSARHQPEAHPGDRTRARRAPGHLPARRSVRPGGGRERRRTVRPAGPIDGAARRGAARAVRRDAARPGRGAGASYSGGRQSLSM